MKNDRGKIAAKGEYWAGFQRMRLESINFALSDSVSQAPNSMGNTAPVGEDCLYLNVWTPAKRPGEKIPVIFWIYGGGYSGGSTSIPMYD